MSVGIVCVGARARFSGNYRWEERYPEAASALQQLAQVHAQQAPTFNSSIAYTCLTAAESLRQLAAQDLAMKSYPLPVPCR